MAYTPQQWHDDTTSPPYGPINGTRLNYIEAGIEAAAAVADAAGGGGASIGTAVPLMDGAASAGVGTVSSAVDHVHPTDTSRAPLASPTFTGHPVGVTETALNNSTRLATTAYTDTAVGVETTRATAAEGLFAPLASPTFTGTPSLPTGTTGSTQSAADSTTKLATTAFVTTADNLKANLASPTFTGSPVLPTGTTGTTQSANDNSTKLATTAYADTGLALKANLAGPTFTGSPVLPTGTTGVTQSALDNSTKLATTAYVNALTSAVGGVKIIRRTSNSSAKNANVTLSNDDTLLFSIGANEVWFVECRLLVAAANATSDFRWNWSVPSGCTYQWGSNAGGGNLAGWLVTTAANTPNAITTSADVVTGSANGTLGQALDGIFTNGATPGTVNLQWAQGTSDASNNTVQLGSFLRITRLA